MTCVALPSNDDLPEWLELDRRSQSRSRTMYCHGKIVASGFEQICQIRNISPCGISVESRDLPQPGQRVQIEMTGMAPSYAVVVWRDSVRCGLVFETEQNLEEIFAARGARAGILPRGPRFSLRMEAEFASREGIWPMELLDISVGGLKLRGEIAAGIGGYGVIRMAGVANDIIGRICWKRNGSVGFRFERTLPRDALFNILSCRS